MFLKGGVPAPPQAGLRARVQSGQEAEERWARAVHRRAGQAASWGLGDLRPRNGWGQKSIVVPAGCPRRNRQWAGEDRAPPGCCRHSDKRLRRRSHQRNVSLSARCEARDWTLAAWSRDHRSWDGPQGPAGISEGLGAQGAVRTLPPEIESGQCLWGTAGARLDSLASHILKQSDDIPMFQLLKPQMCISL